MSGLLHSIGLLLVGRGVVLSTTPEQCGDERVLCEILFNRERREFRVVSNVSMETAQDIYADLQTVREPRLGTHGYTAALGGVFAQKGVSH